jgi:hypothetical protein
MLALLLAASLGGATNDFTLVAGAQRDAERIGPYRFGADPTYAAAVKALGRPTALGAETSAGACVVRWTKLALEVRFGTGAAQPCTRASLTTGGFAGATIYSRRWRTEAGLAVGDPVSRLRRLYPNARYADTPPDPPRWLLVYRRGEVGVTVYLEAFVWAGRVAALDLPPGNVSVGHLRAP